MEIQERIKELRATAQRRSEEVERTRLHLDTLERSILQIVGGIAELELLLKQTQEANEDGTEPLDTD